MEKQFIDRKRSEILSVFLMFPCTTQIALFWPNLLPEKPRYPCHFEILAEALSVQLQLSLLHLRSGHMTTQEARRVMQCITIYAGRI
jgi:hypothetical protein